MNVKHMIATVQIYIHIMKGVEVDISIRDTRDLMLLTSAYTIAKNWMNNNVIVNGYV